MCFMEVVRPHALTAQFVLSCSFQHESLALPVPLRPFHEIACVCHFPRHGVKKIVSILQGYTQEAPRGFHVSSPDPQPKTPPLRLQAWRTWWVAHQEPAHPGSHLGASSRRCRVRASDRDRQTAGSDPFGALRGVVARRGRRPSKTGHIGTA